MFAYKICYYDEFSKTPTLCYEGGIVRAADYATAAGRIVEFYGKENFSSFEGLYELDDILTDEDLKEIYDDIAAWENEKSASDRKIEKNERKWTEI